jgi:pterin-4a-carbinolamine dehydratase
MKIIKTLDIVKFVGNSGSYIKRENDKIHRHQLKGGQIIFKEIIFKDYQSSSKNVLQVVDKNKRLFHVKSERIPNVWYNVSLNTHYCDCPDTISTCKHIYAVHIFVKEYFEKSKDKEVIDELLPMIRDTQTIEVERDFQMDVPIDEPSVVNVTGEKSRETITNAQTLLESLKESIGNYSEIEKQQKQQLVQNFIASCVEPATFERPSLINMPRRGSISTQQENVQRIRMGHGQKHAVSKISEGSTPRPPIKRPSHMFVSRSKQKRAIFCKISKLTCDICATKTLVEPDNDSIFCKNCEHKIFVKKR